MAYLYGLIIVGLFFAVMHFYTELTLQQKINATIIVFMVVMGAAFYNILQSEKAEHIRDVLLRFNQGKEIQCGSVIVDQKQFTLSIGTQAFIGNQETPHAGKILLASECE